MRRRVQPLTLLALVTLATIVAVAWYASHWIAPGAQEIERPDASAPADAPSVDRASAEQLGLTEPSTPPTRATLEGPLAERRSASAPPQPSPDRRCYGRVIACDGELPIRNARVELCRALDMGASELSDDDAVLRAVLTDADGRFEFEHSSSQAAFVRVRAVQFGSVDVAIDTTHTHADPQVICLELGAIVVMDLVDVFGSEIQKASFRVTADATEVPSSGPTSVAIPDRVWTPFLDSSTRDHIVDLPAHVPLRVHAELEDDTRSVADQFVVLAPGEIRTIRWTLEAGCRLEGVVLDQHDVPVARRAVVLRRPRETLRVIPSGEGGYSSRITDDEGRFVFEDVPCGTWWVAVLSNSGARASHVFSEGPSDAADRSLIAGLPAVVELNAVAPKHTLELRVHRGLVISGRVLDPASNPTTLASVRAREESGLCEATAEVTDDGTFHVGALIPGRYRLVATSRFGHAASEPVSATVGETGVELRLRVGGGLEGRVVDAASGRPSGAELALLLRDAFDARTSTFTSRADGVFVLRGLEPGVYDVRATTEDGRFGELASVRVDAGIDTRGLSIAVRAGAELWLSCADPSTGGAYVIARGAAVLASGTLRRGGTASCVVPAGRIEVSFTLDGASVATQQSFEVEVGERRRIVFGEDMCR